MMKFSITSAAVLALAVAACGETGSTPAADTAANKVEASGDIQGRVYSATGEVTEITGDQVTISHGPVEAIGWPAMTMAFRAESPALTEGIEAGDPVSFEFREAEGVYVLTSISRAQ